MSCAGRVDQYGNTAHLHERDTTIAVVSRAPIEKIERWKHKMGWTFPWYSSYGSRFNFDYGVSFDDTVDDPHYNYRSAAELKAKYGLAELPSELHGTSVFLRVGERVFHTYSTYGRGTEQVGGTHYYLDMTALAARRIGRSPRAARNPLDRAPTNAQHPPRQAPDCRQTRHSIKTTVHIAPSQTVLEVPLRPGRAREQEPARLAIQRRRGSRHCQEWLLAAGLRLLIVG